MIAGLHGRVELVDDRGDERRLVLDQAIAAVLDKGLRTGDIASPGTTTIGTAQMGEAIVAEMERLSA